MVKKCAKKAFMERRPYIFNELFSGNWDLFKEAVRNPKTIIVYDADLTLINLAKNVGENFYKKHGIKIDINDYDSWTYLTKVAKENKLSKGKIKHAEDGWYNADLIKRAHRYLYIKPLVNKTISLYGQKNNYVLTARNPDLRKATEESFKRELPLILFENILMRKDGGIISHEDTAIYKAGELERLSKMAPWVVFVDDSITFIRTALNSGIKNLLVVNVPFGKMQPDFCHDQLIVIDRYPSMEQGMYPLMDLFDRAIKGTLHP